MGTACNQNGFLSAICALSRLCTTVQGYSHKTANHVKTLELG